MPNNKQLYYCVEWPDAQKFQERDDCYMAYDGFNILVFVPKEVYEEQQKSVK